MPTDQVVIYCLLLVCAIYLFTYVSAPIRIRFGNWHALEGNYEPCPDNDLWPDVVRAMMKLEELGFRIRGQWYRGSQSRISAQISLLEHEHVGDVARILEATGRNYRNMTLTFQTRFSDGTEVRATNTRLAAGLPPLPGLIVVWLPGLRRAEDLYHVHAQVRNRLGAEKKSLPVGEDPISFLETGSRRAWEHLVKQGYYYRDEASAVYRPTWKGAALTAWRLLWPVRPLYRARRRRQTALLLEKLGIEVKPG